MKENSRYGCAGPANCGDAGFERSISHVWRSWRRFFGSFGRGLRRMVAGGLQLENQEFNRAFVVHGADPVEVRYILTPDMRERLLGLRDRFGSQVRIGFRDSCLIAALPLRTDYWEISLHKPVECGVQRSRLEREIRAFTGLVEALNLNTRIWTKD